MGLTAALAGLVVSCATPSRRLPLRAVEDPIVLPKGLASASVRADVSRYEPNVGRIVTLSPGFAVGLTDRLEWHLLSFRYAVLDDAPGSPVRHAPLSLAVQAGLAGFGYSSLEGWILVPLVSIEISKHVANRWLFSASSSWLAGWVESPSITRARYTDTLFPAGGRVSELTFGASVLRQLTERIAGGVSLTVSQLDACVDPSCDWSAREGTAALRLLFRPVHWLTLDLLPTIGERYRPGALATPVDLTGQAVVPPRSVSWIGASGSVAIFW